MSWVKSFTDNIRRGMKKLFMIFSIMICLLSPIQPFDCSNMIKQSNRTRNEYFLKIFLSQDLTDQICIARALGQRADSYIEEFIFGIIGEMNGRDIDRLEYLLRVLLDSVFNTGYDEEELGARVLINFRGITYLISILHTFHDPMLKCQIMKIIPYVHNSAYISSCMTEGEYLVSILKKTGGKPGSQVNGEILCLLDIMRTIGDEDYFFLCQSIIQLSHNRDVVKKAREIMNLLRTRGLD
jgi:hypothetical protein